MSKHVVDPIRSFDATRNPESMTIAERRGEVARILARGLVRSIRLTRSDTSSPVKKVSESCVDGLELGVHAGLTVAPRPAG
jgi:hypothetical protein